MSVAKSSGLVRRPPKMAGPAAGSPASPSEIFPAGRAWPEHSPAVLQNSYCGVRRFAVGLSVTKVQLRGVDGDMRKYSIFAVAREALRGHKGWEAQWTSPEPRSNYDVIIVGGGGHGLGAAYYLAKEHGITNVAVIEKGWLGGGNTGRNTTIIRSNYLYEESMDIYEHSLKLWEGLSQDLNYNTMYSPRGVMMLSHNVHDQQSFKRHINANRLYGIDNEWLTPEQAKAFVPVLDIARTARYPINGAALQRRGGTARHDAAAWGYARAASDRGVHIIQNCEVTGIRRGPGGEVEGVETSRGFIGAKKIGVSAAGHSSVVMEM